MKFQIFKLVLEKAEEPEIKLPTPLDHQKSKRVPEKHLLLLIDYAKAFDCTIALISHASKVMLKILQARLQQYLNWELPDVQAGFRKGNILPTSNCQHLLDDRESKEIPEKHLLLFHWLHKSFWLCGSQQTVENSPRDGNTRPPYLPPEKSVGRSRSNI